MAKIDPRTLMRKLDPKDLGRGITDITPDQVDLAGWEPYESAAYGFNIPIKGQSVVWNGYTKIENGVLYIVAFEHAPVPAKVVDDLFNVAMETVKRAINPKVYPKPVPGVIPLGRHNWVFTGDQRKHLTFKTDGKPGAFRYSPYRNSRVSI